MVANNAERNGAWWHTGARPPAFLKTKFNSFFNIKFLKMLATNNLVFVFIVYLFLSAAEPGPRITLQILLDLLFVVDSFCFFCSLFLFVTVQVTIHLIIFMLSLIKTQEHKYNQYTYWNSDL